MVVDAQSPFLEVPQFLKCHKEPEVKHQTSVTSQPFLQAKINKQMILTTLQKNL